jgi:hypothetical protein
MEYNEMAELVKEFGVSLEPHLEGDWRLYEIVLRMALNNPEGCIEFMKKEIGKKEVKKPMNDVCEEQIRMI